MPFDPISYGAGLTSMGFWRFFIATGIGQLPATIIYSWLGDKATGTIKVILWVFVAVVAIAIIVSAVKPWFDRRILKSVESDKMDSTLWEKLPVLALVDKLFLHVFVGFLIGFDIGWLLMKSTWFDMRMRTGMLMPIFMVAGLIVGLLRMKGFTLKPRPMGLLSKIASWLLLVLNLMLLATIVISPMTLQLVLPIQMREGFFMSDMKLETARIISYSFFTLGIWRLVAWFIRFKLPFANQNKQSRSIVFIKITVSALLIAILLYKSDINKYVALIKNSSPVYLLIAFLLTTLSIILSAYKWRFLITAQGYSVPFTSLIKSYFVGLFFNNFLPTSIGGDVVRAYDLKKMIGNGPAAAASVVAERVLASFTLGLIVLCGMALSMDSLASYKYITIVFVTICFASLFAVVYAHKVGSLLQRFNMPIINKLKNTADSVSSSVKKRPVLVRVLVYSFLFQLMVVLINVFVIKALGLNVPIAFTLLFIPIIFAITMLPISLNGLGVREATYAYFFAQVGLSTEEAVTISICFFLIVTLVSLIGGVIFAARN